MKQSYTTEIELISLTPRLEDKSTLSLDEEMPSAPISVKKASEKINFLDEVNQSYSSKSTKNFLSSIPEDFELGFKDLMAMAGPWLAVGIWVFLKACPEKVRKTVLSILSPIRNTVKSMRTVAQTAEMTGVLNGLPGPLKTGIGSATGLVAAALMTMIISPKIKILEERIQRRIKLNELLKKHLEHSNVIPQGLSELQLLQWLEDPTQFANLPRRKINENDFADYSYKDAKQLSRYKKLAEIINGVYALSVLNSNLSLAGAKQVFCIPFVSLVTNTVVGTAMVYNSYQIAKHHTEGLLLEAEKSCLSGKLVLSNSSPITSITQEQLQTKLSSCKQKIQNHQSINFNRFHLANASFKGFLEGAETVDLIVGIPIAALVLAHIFSATCPPLYFAVLGVTIAAGLYVGYKRYQQKKQELKKQTKLESNLAVEREDKLQYLPKKSLQSKPQTECTNLLSVQKAKNKIIEVNKKTSLGNHIKSQEIELQLLPSKYRKKTTAKALVKKQGKSKSKAAQTSKQKSMGVSLSAPHGNSASSGLIKLSSKFRQILGMKSPVSKVPAITSPTASIGLFGSQSKTLQLSKTNAISLTK